MEMSVAKCFIYYKIALNTICIRGEKLAVAECNCTVDGQVVSSAELMFAVVEEGEA